MSERIQEAIKAEMSEIVIRVKDQAITLVRIPPGEFTLGSPADEIGRRDTEGPTRRITISRPFYMGKFEITQEQYQAVMGQNSGRFTETGLAVDQLTVAMAREFCSRLSQIAQVEVTLPTEAQWEYACRAGTKAPYYSGATAQDLDAAAWYKANSAGRVHPVGEKTPNAFGLHDMLGNVWEVCLDSLANYGVLPPVDPVGSVSQEGGAMRGGGWMNEVDRVRCASSMGSNEMFGGMGMRVVINPQRKGQMSLAGQE